VDDPTPTERAAQPGIEFDQVREQRQALKSRHAHALNKLMDEREDLRGVHALADMVADSLRWSA
jgi:hypothetical protein